MVRRGFGAASGRCLVVTAMLLGPLAGAIPARAQMESREGIALQNQILELRHELQDLRDQSGRGGGDSVLAGRQPAGEGAGADIVPQLLARVQALEDSVRTINGRLDELQNAQTRQYQDLAKQIGDLNFKLGGGAAPAQPGADAAPPQLSPPPGALGRPTGPTAAPTTPPPTAPPASQASVVPRTPEREVPRTPERGIAEASAALARHDYATAEALAREVVQTNRISPRAYDAQFLLAEALAGKRDFPQAAIAFDDAYNRAKTGVHAPEALLGLASSLTAIGEKRAACETLVKLVREFPSPRPNVREAAGAIRQRAGCQ
jgi:TolA-binding protein